MIAGKNFTQAGEIMLLGKPRMKQSLKTGAQPTLPPAIYDAKMLGM
jgi:hypothetical protein